MAERDEEAKVPEVEAGPAPGGEAEVVVAATPHVSSTK